VRAFPCARDPPLADICGTVGRVVTTTSLCVRTCICLYVRAFMRACVRAGESSLVHHCMGECVRARAYVRACVRASWTCVQTCARAYICACMREYVRKCARAHVRAYMQHACMRTCVRAYVRACVLACVCACVLRACVPAGVTCVLAFHILNVRGVINSLFAHRGWRENNIKDNTP
jgi:hypothetical protein